MNYNTSNMEIWYRMKQFDFNTKCKVENNNIIAILFK